MILDSTEERNTETVLRLLIKKPIEEHIGSDDEDSKCVEQHLNVWEYLVGRDMPLCLERVSKVKNKIIIFSNRMIYSEELAIYPNKLGTAEDPLSPCQIYPAV